MLLSLKLPDILSQDANQYARGVTGPLNKGDASDKLLKVAMPIRDIDSDFCTAGPAVQLPDTKVCAGDGRGDTGKGDSGGPLIDQETGQLIGIVSIGPRYTKVSSYIPFINDIINNGINGVDPRRVTS